MKRFIIIVLAFCFGIGLISFVQAKETELVDIKWGMSKDEVAETIEGEIVGETLVINGKWKGHAATFECRFTDGALFAMNIFPREKKKSGQYYEDFLSLIVQLSRLYGDPTFDDEKQIDAALSLPIPSVLVTQRYQVGLPDRDPQGQDSAL